MLREKDNPFAVAHLRLALVYGQLGYDKSMERTFEKAMRFTDRAAEKEAMAIQAAYTEIVEKDRGKRISILKKMAEKYPGEKAVQFGLAALLEEAGHPEDAVKEYETFLHIWRNGDEKKPELAGAEARPAKLAGGL